MLLGALWPYLAGQELVQPANRIDGKLLLGHNRCASAIRSRKRRATSSALASGC